MYLDRLLNLGNASEWGIHGVGLLDADRDHLAALRQQDGLYTLMVRNNDGSISLRVIGSIVAASFAPDDPAAVLDLLTEPSIRIVSLTVTEGGYNIDQVSGEFDVNNVTVRADLAAPQQPRTVFGYVVEALARRRTAGIPPFTVMSCDNLQANGDVAGRAFCAFAELRDPELAGWMRTNVSFPNSMVDRITPVATPEDLTELRQLGVADAWPVVTESFDQWALEDAFPAGRPDFGAVGVQLTNDVVPYELMKLRLLNVGHQILAHSAHLAGYTYVHDAAADPVFAAFLRGYLQQEARPTLLPVEGIDLDDYIETLLCRFTNRYLRDTVARLCAYTSDRIPKWVVPIVERNLAEGSSVRYTATLIAAWARYAEGIDEQGQPIVIVDTAEAEVRAAAAGQATDLLAFLRNRRFFADLVDNERFTTEYTTALLSLRSVGAKTTLAAASG
jgi:mannitol 2-dehydrogenase